MEEEETLAAGNVGIVEDTNTNGRIVVVDPEQIGAFVCLRPTGLI